MEVIKHHIETHLPDFTVNDQSVFFDELFDSLCSENKLDYKALLIYIFQVIESNSRTQLDTNFFNSLHLHLEIENNLEIKSLILEFLWCYYFNKAYDLDKKEDVNNELENKIEKLTKLVDRPLEIPYNITKPQEKKLRKDRSLIRQYLKAYKTLNINSSLVQKSIINVKAIQDKHLSELLEKNPFYLRIQELSDVNSYVVVNFESFNSISKLKLDNIPIFKLLENIILFDCEDRVQRFNQFNFQNLQNLNQRHGTSFKNFILITFGKNDNSVNSIRNKLDLIKDRFKIPISSSYTILNSEIDFLLKRKEKSSPSIEFIGFESLIFWNEFILETQITGLYELRSIKLMNIYSICYTDEIKNYILNDLFSNEDKSELISNNSTTKQAIIQLRDEDVEKLKQTLSQTLDLIIKSDIKSKIIENISSTPTIILDEAILRIEKLLSKIRSCLGLTRSTKFKTWSDMLNSDLKDFLILSYRDQGRYPNYYFPNLLEIELDSKKTVKAILPNFLFGYHFNWSKYNLLKDYYKLLSHPIRENYFEWNTLKSKIQNLKPEQEVKIDWNLENTYSSTENKESYKVKLSGQRAKLYHSSDFIIYSDINSEVFRIERIKWFFENIDCEESKYRMQKLDELLDEFNPAEKLIDTSQQEMELQIIRNQLGLENETAGRIWKVLLNKKAEIIGIDTLYSDLLQLFSNNNIPLVKQSYFISSWLNTQNDTLMPRGNKIVKVLFDYLQLSNNYRLILYRLKNASITGKIEATRKYSNLLKDLFSNGCFDSNSNFKLILQNKVLGYQQNHSLEELGIDSENPISGLIALVELIKPEIKTVELETIDKVSNE